MNQLPLTIVGNLTDDPELRFTPSGVAVARFTVAHNPRRPDGDGNWADGEPTFMPCTAWRQLAEHIALCCKRGIRMVVTGTMRTERWENDKGEKRSRIVLDVIAAGPELTYATATVKKLQRDQGDPDDPWATAGKARPAAPAPDLAEAAF